jgi:hypothetical protein
MSARVGVSSGGSIVEPPEIFPPTVRTPVFFGMTFKNSPALRWADLKN